MDEYKLDTSWSLWTHSIHNKNWNINSYNKLFEINSLFDFIYLESKLKLIHYENNMIFIMKPSILPLWESPDNINGCTFSFKIPKKDIYEWYKLLFKCIGNTIYTDDSKSNLLNGLSIVPKTYFFIIKLWISNNIELNDLINTYSPYILEKLSIKKLNKN